MFLNRKECQNVCLQSNQMLKVRLFLFAEKTAVSVQRCVNLLDMT